MTTVMSIDQICGVLLEPVTEESVVYLGLLEVFLAWLMTSVMVEQALTEQVLVITGVGWGEFDYWI